jgi:cation diffusion facilitator family transporter
MDDCCGDAARQIERLESRQVSTLKVVFGINAVMFAAEMVTGVLAGSVSLVSDSLDMLGDALAYGLSLYVVRRSNRWKAQSAIVKGAIMAALGLAALSQAAYKAWVPHPPSVGAMGLMGLAALAANAGCLGLLWRHRSEDINMHSVWVCSRNDIVANISVLVSAACVWFWHSGWPDIIIGAALAVFILRSSVLVLRRAWSELGDATVAPRG